MFKHGKFHLVGKAMQIILAG